MHHANRFVDDERAATDDVVEADATRDGRSRRSRSRRRRTVRLRHRLRGLARIVPRRSDARLRLAALVCLIGGFVVISARNDVPVRLAERAAPDVVRSEAVQSAGDQVVAARGVAGLSPVPDPPTAAAKSASAVDGVGEPGATPARRAASANAPVTSPLPPLAGAAADIPSLDALRERFVAFDEPIVYTVNEGGSLWRTTRRIVGADDALVHEFVDTLSAGGMRVGRVRAGEEVIADAAVGRGYRLRVDDDDAVYVAHLADGVATVSAYRIATVAVRTLFELDAVAAGVPESVIESLSTSDASTAVTLANTAVGETVGVLYRSFVDDGGERTGERVLAIETDSGVHRIEGIDTADSSLGATNRLSGAGG